MKPSLQDMTESKGFSLQIKERRSPTKDSKGHTEHSTPRTFPEDRKKATISSEKKILTFSEKERGSSSEIINTTSHERSFQSRPNEVELEKSRRTKTPLTEIVENTDVPKDCCDFVEQEDVAPLFDLEGHLVEGLPSSIPILVDNSECQGVEKRAFTFLELLTLTRSTVLQQRIAAWKSITRIFCSIWDGNLTANKALEVLKTFDTQGGPLMLVNALERPHYLIVSCILDFMQVLTLGNEHHLFQFEERWKYNGILEEDLEKFRLSRNCALENLERKTKWKQQVIVVHLVENYLLSMLLRLLKTSSCLRPLQTRIFHSVYCFFVTFVISYWCRNSDSTRAVTKALIKELLCFLSCQACSSLCSRLLYWCLAVIPDDPEGFDLVVKYNGTDIFCRVRGLRIIGHFNSFRGLRPVVFDNIKEMLEYLTITSDTSNYFPIQECMHLFREYVDKCDSISVEQHNELVVYFLTISDYLKTLFHFLEGSNFYSLLEILTVADLILSLVVRLKECKWELVEEKAKSTLKLLENIALLFDGHVAILIQNGPSFTVQNDEEQVVMFLLLRIICLMQLELYQSSPLYERLRFPTWMKSTNLDTYIQEEFETSLGFSNTIVFFLMLSLSSQFHVRRGFQQNIRDDITTCFDILSLTHTADYIHLKSKLLHILFSAESISLYSNQTEHTKRIPDCLQLITLRILSIERHVNWWIPLVLLPNDRKTLETVEKDIICYLRFLYMLLKETNVFCKSYATLFFELMKQLLSLNLAYLSHLSIGFEIQHLIFSLLCFDTSNSYSLYLEEPEGRLSLLDNAIDYAYGYRFLAEEIPCEIIDSLQSTIYQMMMNSSYNETFRIVLWRKCLKSSVHLEEPRWISGPLTDYVKPFVNDICFAEEMLSALFSGIVNKRRFCLTYLMTCFRMARTIFEEYPYGHLLVRIVMNSSESTREILQDIFNSYIDERTLQEVGKPIIRSYADVIDIFKHAKASHELLRYRYENAMKHCMAFRRFVQDNSSVFGLFSRLL